MAKSKNEILGHITCPGCDGQCTVHQAKRKGAHLFTHCDECGIDQRTGVAVQTRLYYGSTWLDGARVTKPSNVGDKPAEEPVVTKPDLKVEKPTEPTKPEPKKSTKPTEQGQPKGLLWVGGGLLVLAAGAALWLA